YKIDDTAKNVLRLSAKFEDDDRALSLYQIQVALRLPHSDEKLAKSIIEHRERRLEKASQSTRPRPINHHEIRTRPADAAGRRCHCQSPPYGVVQAVPASGRTPPRWLFNTAPKRPSPIGASGWSVPDTSREGDMVATGTARR